MVARGKDFKEYAEGESIYNNIFSRIIKDVLSSEQAADLVEDVMQQAPRLYCFFDKDEPVNVDDMERDQEATDENEDIDDVEEMEQSQRELPTGQLAESRDDRNADGVSSELKLPNPYETSAMNQSMKDARNSPNPTTQSAFEETTKGKLSLVPEHVGLRDVIREEGNVDEEGNESPAKLEGATEIGPARVPKKEIDETLVKEEFKSAAQSVLDDVFMQLIRDAVSGRVNLNERLIRSNTKGMGSRSGAGRLRSQRSMLLGHQSQSKL